MKTWKRLVILLVAMICTCLLYVFTKYILLLLNAGFLLGCFVFIFYTWIELSLKIHDFDW